MVKYVVLLLALSAIALAGKKDEYRGGCPCADFKSYEEIRVDESCSRGKRVPLGDDEFSRKERKSFEKRQDKKYKTRYSEGMDEVDGLPEDMSTSYNFYEGSDGFLSRRDAEARRQRKEKKYMRRDDFDVDEDFEVSPACQRFVHDVNRLAKCERKQVEKMSSEGMSGRRSFVGAEFADVTVACQKYVNADDPAKLARCVRKHDAEQPTTYPECVDFVNDPYKLEKCERKARKYAGASTGRMLF